MITPGFYPMKTHIINGKSMRPFEQTKVILLRSFKCHADGARDLKKGDAALAELLPHGGLYLVHPDYTTLVLDFEPLEGKTFKFS